MSYNHQGISIDLNYCHTTYPCLHACSVDGGLFKLMNATEIIKLLSDRQCPIPGHFAEYKKNPDPIDPEAHPICIKRYLAYFDVNQFWS